MGALVLHNCNGVRLPCSRREAARPVQGLCRPPGRLSFNVQASFLPSNQMNVPFVAAARRRQLPGRAPLCVAAVFEQFSDRSIQVAMMSQQLAKKYKALEVNSEHIFLGLVAEGSLSRQGYLNSGLTIDRASKLVEEIGSTNKGWSLVPVMRQSNEAVPFSADVRKTFQLASNECKRIGSKLIFPEHILIATLDQQEANWEKIFNNLGVDAAALRAEAYRRLMGEVPSQTQKKKKKAETEEKAPKMLDQFCKDLCEEARKNKIDPLVGREAEVMRVIQILGRRTKNNPILLGDPGVGKTAIAEGIARAIVSKTNVDGTALPEVLVEKRVMQLDLGVLVAGAKERGELEKRVTQLIEEVKKEGNIILMIDEVHTLVGAGTSSRGGKGGGSGVDMSQILKPALSAGYLQLIGSTTVAEHRRYFERDPALSRRFQPVMIEAASEDMSLQILKVLRERYELHHRCVYSDEALEAAVKLSSKYIADRLLPDKAIDLMDEAGSKVRIQAYNERQERDVRESIRVTEFLQVLQIKDQAVKDERYDDAYMALAREQLYRSELTRPARDGPAAIPLVREADIEAIVSTWSRIPVEKLEEGQAENLAKLADTLAERVVGQDDAVECVAAAMQRSFAGLKDPERPIASLLFVGPTGVGKTELAKVLAEAQFGTKDALIRFDMSEFMERHSVSKLIGAPPGYVGYGEGGLLTEAVRRRPFSIVLLDEVEKAHPDVFNILLQILEDGRLTDSGGRTVSFRNTLLILTSNIGSRSISSMSSLSSRLGQPTPSDSPEPAAATGQQGVRIGGDGSEGLSEELVVETEVDQEISLRVKREKSRMRRMVLDEVKAHFRPELINRFDEQVVFQHLGVEAVNQIADLMLQETCTRVSTQGHVLEVSPQLRDHIVAEGYSREYGVRPLRRTITRLIDDNLSDELLANDIPVGSMISMDLNGAREVVISIRQTNARENGEEDDEVLNNILNIDLVVEVKPSSAATYYRTNE